MTFDELFAEHRLSTEERSALVRFLAILRYEATLRALAGSADGDRAKGDGA